MQNIRAALSKCFRFRRSTIPYTLFFCSYALVSGFTKKSLHLSDESSKRVLFCIFGIVCCVPDWTFYHYFLKLLVFIEVSFTR